MKKYRLTYRLFILSLFLYSFFVITNRIFLSTREVFPIFAWDLFSHTPNPNLMTYNILINEVDGMLFQEPIDVFRSDCKYAKNSSRFYKITQALGKAIDNDDHVLEASLRKLIEHSCLKQFKKEIKYSIALSEMNVIEKWKGNHGEMKILKNYVAIK